MTGRGLAWGVAAAGVLVVSSSRSAAAQHDFRSIDDGRPGRVEDAYPLKFREFEWELGTKAGWEEGGAYELEPVLELKTGIARNAQFGVEIHAGLARASGINSSGVEEFAAHLLYNVNQETRTAPAFALRADVMVPVTGDLSRERAGARVRGMVTRSLGVTRLHANLSFTAADALDGGHHVAFGLAVDRALGLASRTALADIYVEVPTAGGRARTWVDLGTRLQVTKTLVFDAGVWSRVDEWTDGVANLGITFGLSRMFGIPGLTRVPPYPNPSIK